MNKKQVIILSLFMLVSTTQAGKKPSKRTAPEAAVVTEQVEAPKKIQPLRNIARESLRGHNPTQKEQTIFLEESLDDTCDDVSMIRYTITIFKDKERHSMGDWDCATRSTVQRFTDLSAQHNDWVEDIVDDIRVSLHKAFAPDAPRCGIHAEVKIQMSSGEQPSDCKCGSKCGCATRYAGNCPCSLETPKAYPAEVRVSCLDRKK